jgi:hypothetical protein
MKSPTYQRQRAQTQSCAAREPLPINLSERLALSPREFAAAVGRSPTYAYRQIYAGRLRPIWDAGRLLIPRSEVDRFLARAAEYNPHGRSSGGAHESGGRE